MSVPTHNAGCQTVTWRTTCRDCGKAVFFFSCSCGSKVFFDLLGDPWPLHADSCPIYHARTMIHSGVDARTIRKLLDSEAKVRGVAIPPELNQYLADYGAPGKVFYDDELPSSEPCEVEGMVFEINKINFFKRFDLDNNLIIRRLLGDLATEPYVEVVVRENAEQGVQIRKRWTFVVPELVVKGLRKGVTIYAMLEGKPIVDDLAVWVGKDLDWK